MKKLLLIAAMLLMCCITRAQDNPVADPEAVVVSGNARFTLLTSRLVRMEWAEDGIFEDRATLAVVNRRLEVPEFKVRRSGKTLTIKTKDITLRYVGNAPFDSTNLSVSFMLAVTGKPQKVVWRPGADDSGNLLGTTRTLDGFDASKDKPLENGVVSRDGWAVVDESDRHLLVPVESDWKQWVAERPAGKRQDLYIFAYGHDYMAAVSDFARIGGRIPLPPKYAFGYWWSRYWQYSDFEFVDLAEQMRGFGIPIDVMVLDMDWHDTYGLTSKNPRKDDLGQRVGWTGYTWHKGLFPNAANHLTDLHNLGLKTTLNLHPASGIRPYEDKYESFVSDYLARTDDYDGPKGYVNPDGTPQYVPFRIDQMEWADAYFNSIIRPLEREGVDFWWLDWQQWKTSKYTEGLSNTFWLNHTFFNDMVRQGLSEGKYARRPIIYHRWGGLGSHRYQVAFSGDTYAKWEVLAYLPWFTATSSNVGFGYWGHDIGGHYQKKGGTSTDPELYTRWLQSAVFSPIFKTHANKNTTMEKRFWMFPEYFDDMRDAIRLRYTLSPYIYRSAREAYDTGISICRPMYYYWPEDDRAYDCKEQFFFGPDILAASVCTPVDSVTALATRVVWFPEGSDWYDMATGQMYRGGLTDTLRYTIHETPWFVRAGSIIPMASPQITNLQHDNNEIWLCVAPGDGKFETELYEDDGSTQAYESEWATTRVSKESSARSLSLTVEPRSGSYRGMDPNRTVRIVLESVPAPISVKLGNLEIPYSRFAQAQAQASAQSRARAQAPVPAYAQSPSPAYAQSQSPVQASSAAEDHLCAADAVWGYSGKDLSVVIYLPEMPADEQIELTVTYSDESAETRELFYGKKGIIHRFMELTPEVKLEYARKVDICLQLPMPFLTFSQCGSFITEDPYGAVRYIEALDAEALKAELDSRPKLSEEFKHKVLEQAKL
ncbi:MAG: glycoside hydrolase family 31 protein [Bacteroidales bacterium]|nr:glycoside hydrolase family 31 protein [Bacteroidales bacterium]MDD6751039.1 glycoside hydrolase family 31 protein [Bacteroidales bacterium]